MLNQFQSCHRKVVAELAQRWIEGLEVEHLAVSPGGQAIRASELMVREVEVAVSAGKVATLEKRSQPTPQAQMSMF